MYRIHARVCVCVCVCASTVTKSCVAGLSNSDTVREFVSCTTLWGEFPPREAYCFFTICFSITLCSFLSTHVFCLHLSSSSCSWWWCRLCFPLFVDNLVASWKSFSSDKLVWQIGSMTKSISTGLTAGATPGGTGCVESQSSCTEIFECSPWCQSSFTKGNSILSRCYDDRQPHFDPHSPAHKHQTESGGSRDWKQIKKVISRARGLRNPENESAHERRAGVA